MTVTIWGIFVWRINFSYKRVNFNFAGNRFERARFTIDEYLSDITSYRRLTRGWGLIIWKVSNTLFTLQCKRAEKYKQLMSSLWNECKGICIELRVCADCSCGQEQAWKNTSSNFDHILEQWCFEVTNVRYSVEVFEEFRHVNTRRYLLIR